VKTECEFNKQRGLGRNRACEREL